MEDPTKYCILVVDDEHANIMALTHILRPEYTVYAEKNGHDAIKTASELKPDIILLDILMPEIDGYSVISSLKADEATRDIPVVFISGLSDVTSEERGLSLGAADYIMKPFVPVIVRLRVANQLKLISNMRQLMEKELEEKANAQKFEFYMNMNNDMLTPMNIVMGMSQIAKRSNDLQTIKECLNDIDNAAKQMMVLLKKLLDIK